MGQQISLAYCSPGTTPVPTRTHTGRQYNPAPGDGAIAGDTLTFSSHYLRGYKIKKKSPECHLGYFDNHHDIDQSGLAIQGKSRRQQKATDVARQCVRTKRATLIIKKKIVCGN